MRIFVTGSCGYIGSMLVAQALQEGNEVIGLDSLHVGHPSLFDLAGHPRFRFIRGDIRDRKLLEQVLDEARPDAVVHLAAIVGAPACRMDPERAASVNVTGTGNLVGSIREACPEAHLVFASTDSVYGRVDGPCSEDGAVHPLSEYGRDKEAGERIVRGGSRRFTILRFATAFGISRRPRIDLLINDFVWQAVRNRYLVVYEADFRRTFLDVSDIVRAVLLVLDRSDTTAGQTYNVGDDRLNASKADVARIVAAAVPETGLNLLGEGKDPDQRDYIPDHRRIRALGFEATLSISQGVDRLVRGYAMFDVRSPWRNDGTAPI